MLLNSGVLLSSIKYLFYYIYLCFSCITGKHWRNETTLEAKTSFLEYADTKFLGANPINRINN